MAFFNFSIADPTIIAKQVEILQSKFDKWRSANVPPLERERKIRGYVLEALCAYQYKPTDNLQAHPAAPVIKAMMEYLKGYTIRVNDERTGIAIFSPRGTYVAGLVDGTGVPECCMSMMDAIKYEAIHGDVF